ncbi:MAG TPA: dephospho-CoA kinase [Tenuifilaceae bacterium]|nr:dephospho-CoA kinase [Tenuifilaceae bacterium]HPN22660.1 dephospho-CoA kinase [Tenuifilaceae bacterium]HPV57142.1 dephospho-CoA kinase [Tenuifilaceae bacterium]
MTLKVGITGGIGSGKTTVCKVIEALGYPVYYADVEAKKIIETDSDVIFAISALFGSDIYNSGCLDRKSLASLVFNNKELLAKLNGIVHPAVARHFQVWANSSNAPIIFKEAAILFESGLHKLLDKTILVIAPEQVRLERVIDRDNVTVDNVKSRMANQATQDELIKLADYLINNDGKELVTPQLIRIIENLKML